jgi:hypothetical protein
LSATQLVMRTAADVKRMVRLHGSIRAAARAVGIPKSTFHDLLRRGVAFGWRQHLAMGRLLPKRRRRR